MHERNACKVFPFGGYFYFYFSNGPFGGSCKLILSKGWVFPAKIHWELQLLGVRGLDDLGFFFSRSMLLKRSWSWVCFVVFFMAWASFQNVGLMGNQVDFPLYLVHTDYWLTFILDVVEVSGFFDGIFVFVKDFIVLFFEMFLSKPLVILLKFLPFKKEKKETLKPLFWVLLFYFTLIMPCDSGHLDWRCVLNVLLSHCYFVFRFLHFQLATLE